MYCRVVEEVFRSTIIQCDIHSPGRCDNQTNIFMNFYFFWEKCFQSITSSVELPT